MYEHLSCLTDVGQQHVHTVRGDGLRNARAHLARADDGDRFVHLGILSQVQQGVCTSEGVARWLAPA